MTTKGASGPALLGASPVGKLKGPKVVTICDDELDTALMTSKKN